MNRTVILICSLVLLAGHLAYADENKVTPYGDYCRDCTIYGICKDIIPLRESLIALNNYYRAKGYRVGVVRQRGRFLEVDIYKGIHPADKVLFDRKTGRVRSIY